jgi:probable HAF family extracellular repeat protein
MNTSLSSRSVRRVCLATVVGALLGFILARPASAQSSYVVDDLGVLPGDDSSVAWAINENGDVVGWSMGPAGTRAFLYTTTGGMVALSALPGRPRSLARDINDAGVIVGSANAGGTDLGHAVRWSGGSVRDLGALGTGSFSEAWGINNLGEVVGWSYSDGGNGLTGVHGFIYSDAAGLVDLTPESDTGYAEDINDAGQVTGYRTASGGVYHAFRWQEGAFADLGVLSGMAHSFGWAINESGQVAGSSSSASGNTERLFRFTDGAGLENLGGTGEHNVAWGISASGEVVGTRGQSGKRAVLFTDAGGLRDLDTLIDGSLGWVILSAHDINDDGEIVGYASNSFTGQTHAVRLRPTDGQPPACTFHCLRSTSIRLRILEAHAVRGRVTVLDEDGVAIPRALVVGRWTQPNGSHREQMAWTRSNGVAVFDTTGGRGTYTLTVINIERSSYTFDPDHSLLDAILTVTTW